MKAESELKNWMPENALHYGRGLLDRDEAASRMRALQRATSLFVTEAVVERGIQMLDKQ
jgi:hypothetical protein